MGKSKRASDAVESDEKAFDWGIDVPAKKRKRDDATTEPDAESEVKKSKKDKKDKKSKKDKHQQESRKERKDKKKDLMDLPMEDAEDEEAEVKDEPEPEVKKEKKSKKDKKEKKAEKAAAEVNGDDEPKAEKKDKKKDKAEKKAKKESTAEPTTNGDVHTPVADTADEPSNPNAIDLSPSDAAKADRHIVFVGNLPFSATAASISAHFATLNPIAVRCMKNKDDDKPCKGFAFVEFGKVWHMRTCLDKFHHSMFEDGVSAGRKINVELTAGGGGKTKQRNDKIRAKNEKLDENRAKRIEREKTAKKEGGGKKEGGEDKKEPDNGGMHPSRLARLPGFGQ